MWGAAFRLAGRSGTRCTSIAPLFAILKTGGPLKGSHPAAQRAFDRHPRSKTTCGVYFFGGWGGRDGSGFANGSSSHKRRTTRSSRKRGLGERERTRAVPVKARSTK